MFIVDAFLSLGATEFIFMNVRSGLELPVRRVGVVEVVFEDVSTVCGRLAKI